MAIYREPDGTHNINIQASYREPDALYKSLRTHHSYKSFRLHVAIYREPDLNHLRLYVAIYREPDRTHNINHSGFMWLHTESQTGRIILIIQASCGYIQRARWGALYKSFRLHVATYREPNGTHYIKHSGFMWLYTESQAGIL